MGVPVHCHPDEVADAESDAAIAPYLDLSQLPVARVRWIYPFLLRRWDGGAVKIAGHGQRGRRGRRLPGRPLPRPRARADRPLAGERPAWRWSATSSTWSTRRGCKPLPEGEASVPHPAWAWDHAKAKESVRKLAALEPAVVGAGHDEPLRGENLRETLERAAEKF